MRHVQNWSNKIRYIQLVAEGIKLLGFKHKIVEALYGYVIKKVTFWVASQIIIADKISSGIL